MESLKNIAAWGVIISIGFIGELVLILCLIDISLAYPWETLFAAIASATFAAFVWAVERIGE